MPEPGEPEQPKPPETEEMPSADDLSYSHRDIRLSRTDVDWEMLDPKKWEGLTQDQKDEIIREQNRRIFFALERISKKMDRFVPVEEGVEFSQSIMQILNSHETPHYLENPRVEPPSQ